MDAACDQEAASRRSRQAPFAQRSKLNGNQNILLPQLGEVISDLRRREAPSQVIQHVVDRYPRANEAKLAAANSSPRLKHPGEFHR